MANAQHEKPRSKVGLVTIFAMLVASLVVVGAAASYSPSTAYAVAIQSDGEWVHENGGKTWEEIRDAREEADSDNWDSEWVGGEKVPKVGIFTLWQSFMNFVYTRIIEPSTDAMIGVCNSLFDFLGSTDSLKLEYDNSAFSTVYSATVTISETVIQPIAVGFLGLALVLELLQFSREVATNKGDHFGMAGSYVWIIVKFAAIMVLIGHTTLITRGIYELFLSLTKAVGAVLSVDEIGDYFGSFIVNMQEVTYANWGHLLILWLVALVMVVAVAITVLKVIVLMVTRMFEIYVRAAFSGIPLVMLTNRQSRDGGLRYFKEFAGACLQAAVLIVMVSFAGIIMSAISVILDVPDGGGVVTMIIAAIAPIAGVFGVNAVIGQSREIANRILGA